MVVYKNIVTPLNTVYTIKCFHSHQLLGTHRDCGERKGERDKFKCRNKIVGFQDYIKITIYFDTRNIFFLPSRFAEAHSLLI